MDRLGALNVLGALVLEICEPVTRIDAERLKLRVRVRVGSFGAGSAALLEALLAALLTALLTALLVALLTGAQLMYSHG